MTSRTHTSRLDDLAIWGYAFGYFAAYVPYSALTKALSRGLLGGVTVSDFELLPLSVGTSVIAMYLFISLMGWWKHASRGRLFGRDVPRPTRWTILSGLCTAAIVATTTLAYALHGVSIVFAMLLMRGGVLILAPIVDAITRRRVRWFSWIGLLLSLAALLVAFSNRSGYALTFLAGLDIGIYLASYFFRLRFMSRLAKSPDPRANIRYFVEEQMVATPTLFALLGLVALIGGDAQLAASLRTGFTAFWGTPVLLPILLVGLFSQGTGVFGGLILLDKHENTYCVPVNRSSSVLAGVFASYALTTLLAQPAPSVQELWGAGLIIAAILVLTVPTLRSLGGRGAARRAAAAASAGASSK